MNRSKAGLKRRPRILTSRDKSRALFLRAGSPHDPDRAAEAAAWDASTRRDWYAAFDALVKLYGGPLRLHCERLLNGSDLANDVYQTILMQAFTSLPSFSGRSSFRVWLYTIARHRILDAIKATRRQSRHFSETEEPDSQQEIADPQYTPEEILAHQSSYAELKRALQKLPSKTQRLVLLRFYEGLPYDVISQQSAEPVTTLRMRMSRALRELRRIIDS